MQTYARTVFVLSLALLGACSQRGSQVSLEVRSAFAFGGSALGAISGGGLMVWGKSATGQEFARSLENSDLIQLELAKGTWTFYAMAWQGDMDWAMGATSNHPFGGKIRCAKGVASLDGAPASVPLVLTNANCEKPEFAGAITPSGVAGAKKFAPMRVRFCENITNLTGLADLCDDDLGQAAYKSRRAAVGSFQIHLRAFDGPGTPGSRVFLPGGVRSACVAFNGTSTSSGSTNTSIPGMPAGSPQLPFHITVRTFLSDDCDAGAGARGALEIQLPAGAGAPGPNSKYNEQANTPTAHRWHSLALPDATVCAGRTSTSLGGHPFAGGTGTLSNPYALCSPQQLNQMNLMPLNAHYRVLRDLDFNPVSQGLGTLSVAGDASCLNPGTNFVPIGHVNQSCSGEDPAYGAVTAFTGHFDGRGYALKNLRFRQEELPVVGLFAKLDSNARVVDFTLEKPEITGGCRVGGVAGEAWTSAEVSRVVIKGGNIAARLEDPDGSCDTASEVGALVGIASGGATINYSRVEKSRVRGVHSYVGGAVGKMVSGTLNRVAVDADIDANSPASGKEGIGGVVGYASGVVMAYVKHEGALRTSAIKVGGIAGITDGSGSLTNFYALSSIWNDQTAGTYTGGAVGYSGATGPFGPGYTLSVVHTGCTSSCSHGSVVGYQGGTPSTSSLHYTVAGENGSLPSPTTFPSETALGSLTAAHTPLANMTGLPNAGTDDWAFTSGELPRFDFEKHPCTSGLSGTGQGTSASPKLICNTGQFNALGSAGAGTFHRLAGTVRLSNSNTSAYQIGTLSAHLQGDGNALLGGKSVLAVGSDTAYFQQIATGASVKNLRVLGMARSRTVASTDSAQIAALFASTNNGVMENVTLLNGHGDFLDRGAGVVGVNAGTMSRISFDGLLVGGHYLAGLTYTNSNMLEYSRFRGELRCNDVSGCQGRGGLSYINSGTLRRSVMEGRIMDWPSTPTHEAAALVFSNVAGGTLVDSLVTPYATFRIFGNTPHAFTAANSGTLNRLYSAAAFRYDDATYGSLPTGWGQVHNPNLSGGGTATNVLFTGVSGKELVSYASFSCNNANTFNFPNWGDLGGVWDTPLATYNGLAASGKQLFIEYYGEDASGNPVHGVEVLGAVATGTTAFTTVAASTCPDSPGFARIFWTDLPPYSDPRILLPQEAAAGKSSFGEPWANLMWDMSLSADRNAMVAYQGYRMGVPGFPAVTPAIWEFEEGEIRLTELED